MGKLYQIPLKETIVSKKSRPLSFFARYMFDQPEETLTKKFIQKGFWIYFFTFLAAPLGYIIKIILARDLPSVNDFGIFYGIISLLTLISALNDFGCTESLNYFLPKYLIKKEYGKAKYLLRFVLFVQLTTSVLIMGGIYYFADTIALGYFKDPDAAQILRIMSLFFLGTNLININTTLFNATQNMKLRHGVEFLRLLSTTCCICILLFFGFGNLKNYSWAWISGVFFAMIFAGYMSYTRYFKKYFNAVSLEKDTFLRKKFILYALPTFLTANIGIILSQIDAQIIIVMLGNEAQGYYSTYLSIINIPFLFIAPLISFLFPVIAELHAKGQQEKMKLLSKNFTLYLTIIALWVAVFLFQIGTPLTLFLFGQNFALSGYILQFSCFFLLFNILLQINFQFLAGTGKVWHRTLSLIIALPINIGLTIVFIHLYGIAGAALAVGLSWIPLYFLSWYFTREYQCMPRLFPIFWNIGAIALASMSIYELTHFLSLSTIQTLFLACLIYFIIFLTANISLLKEGVRLIISHRL